MARAIRVASIKLGPITIPTGILGAVDDEDAGLVTVCTHGDDKTRLPARIKRVDYCPTCDEKSRDAFRKGRLNGNAVVLIDADALQALAVDESLKTSIELTTHPVEQLAGAFPTGKSYYLAPRPGASGPYALLAAVMQRTPQLAYVGEFSFGGPAMLYQVTVGEDNVLSLRQLARPDMVRARPVVDGTANEKYLDLATQLAEALCVDFDATAYADKRRAALAAIVERSMPVALADTGTSEAAAPVSTNLEGALLAALSAAGTPVAPARPVRAVRAPAAKAPAKKVPPQKTPAKKASTKPVMAKKVAAKVPAKKAIAPVFKSA